MHAWAAALHRSELYRQAGWPSLSLVLGEPRGTRPCSPGRVRAGPRGQPEPLGPGEPRKTRSLVLRQGKGRPGGQPGTASCGGKLSGRQPCTAASYIGKPGGRAWTASGLASRVARGLALQRDIRAGLRGQPEASSRGGKLYGQQPFVAVSYRQAGRQSLSRSEPGEPRGRAALHSSKVRAGHPPGHRVVDLLLCACL